MRKVGAVILVLIMLALVPVANAVKPTVNTITKGEVVYSATHYLAEQAIPIGFDAYGYNYQGHMFSGSYYNSYAGGAGFPPWTGDDTAYLAVNPMAASHWAWPYRDVKLAMKWNDAWISNVDYSGDKLLDRHWGYTDYPNSGAWLTNHQSGEYLLDGKTIKWNYFVKIVTPSPLNGDYIFGGIWYTSGGVEIGPVIWGAFAVVQQVENDAGSGLHGLQYISDASAGLGHYPAY